MSAAGQRPRGDVGPRRQPRLPELGVGHPRQRQPGVALRLPARRAAAGCGPSSGPTGSQLRLGGPGLHAGLRTGHRPPVGPGERRQQLDGQPVDLPVRGDRPRPTSRRPPPTTTSTTTTSTTTTTTAPPASTTLPRPGTTTSLLPTTTAPRRRPAPSRRHHHDHAAAPAASAASAAATLVGRYEWAYPDQQYNTEAVFAFEGDLVVISKSSPAGCTASPSRCCLSGSTSPSTWARCRPATTCRSPPDGRRADLAVGSHNSVYMYENSGDRHDLADLIADSPSGGRSCPTTTGRAGASSPTAPATSSWWPSRRTSGSSTHRRSQDRPAGPGLEAGRALRSPACPRSMSSSPCSTSSGSRSTCSGASAWKDDRQRVFGGQVAGQALVAAGRTVEPASGGALAARLLPAARRPEGPDRLRGRPHPRRAVVHHPAGGRHPARRGDLQPAGLVPRRRGRARAPGPDARRRRRPTTCPGRTRWSPGTPERHAVGPSTDRHAPRRRPAVGTGRVGRPPASWLWFRANGALPDDPLLHTCIVAYASDYTLLDIVAGAARHVVLPGRRCRWPASTTRCGSTGPFRADEWLLYHQHEPVGRQRPRVWPTAVDLRRTGARGHASCRRASSARSTRPGAGDRADRARLPSPTVGSTCAPTPSPPRRRDAPGHGRGRGRRRRLRRGPDRQPAGGAGRRPAGQGGGALRAVGDDGATRSPCACSPGRAPRCSAARAPHPPVRAGAAGRNAGVQLRPLPDAGRAPSRRRRRSRPMAGSRHHLPPISLVTSRTPTCRRAVGRATPAAAWKRWPPPHAPRAARPLRRRPHLQRGRRPGGRRRRPGRRRSTP